MHCHLLPGLDDGAPDMDASLEMGAALYHLGFDTICATPHVHPGMWDGAPEEVVALVGVVEEELLDRLRPPGNGDEADVRVVPGGEHFLDAAFIGRMEEGRLIEYPRDRGVLVELSLMPGASHPGLRDVMFRIRVKGLRPVLAHPERYDSAQRSVDWVGMLRSDGVAMLGDLPSLVGKSGRKARRTLERMLDLGLVDGMATDAHSVDDVHVVEQALGRLEKNAGRQEMERLLTWGRAFTG
jgi:protein-tyrosine phosphatase